MRWHLVRNGKLAFFLSLLAAAGAVSSASAITTVQSRVCEDFTAPVIVMPSDGTQTTQSTVMIEGTGEPGKTVEVLRNGAGQGSAAIASDGSFGFTVILEQGSNSFIAREINECDTVKDSASVMVIADFPLPPVDEPTAPGEAPPDTGDSILSPSINGLGKPFIPKPGSHGFEKPVITLPGDGAVVYSDTFLMEGAAYPGSLVTIYINDKSQAQLVSGSDGKFRVRIVLREGQNTIKVRSTYAGKVSTSDTITVVYIKKVTATLTRPLSPNEIATTALAAGAAVTGSAAAAIAINWSFHKGKLKFWRRK